MVEMRGQKPLGRAHIRLPLQQAVTAIDQFNHSVVRGRRIVVQMARSVETAGDKRSNVAPTVTLTIAPTTSIDSSHESSSDVEMDTDTSTDSEDDDEEDDENDAPAGLSISHTPLPQDGSGDAFQDTNVPERTLNDEDTDDDQMDLEPSDGTTTPSDAEDLAPTSVIVQNKHSIVHSDAYGQTLADDLAPELQPEPQKQSRTIHETVGSL